MEALKYLTILMMFGTIAKGLWTLVALVRMVMKDNHK